MEVYHHKPQRKDYPALATDAGRVKSLLSHCPKYAKTPIRELAVNGFKVYLKDERNRMELGSFKALGAAFVIAKDAQKEKISHKTYICASAGNHGLSVATGARIFGANAIIILAKTVPDAFETRLRRENATVIRYGDAYEEGMDYAKNLAQEKGYVFLPDTSWQDGYQMAHGVMEGYTVVADEVLEELTHPPEYIFLQAGVGGFAAAQAIYLRKKWGEKSKIVVVEPEKAPAIIEGIKKGKVTMTKGGVSNMGRLDCKEASFLALFALMETANVFMTISDEEAQEAVDFLNKQDIKTTPSGGGGFAGFYHGARTLNIPQNATVLAFITEQS